MNNKFINQFTILGILFGFMFPLGATLIDLFLIQGLSFSIENIILVQTNNPLHWIIDSAPLVIGSTAHLIGIRQNNLIGLSKKLELQLKEQTNTSQELDDLRISLEDKVQARTKELERRTQFIEAAADVGRASISIYKIDELLPKIVEFISERFGFYQAGIFLIDEFGEYAVMRAASSEGGRRMMARAHKLRVGEQGMVGYVTSTGEARIALDVGEDASHFDNPELPNTRSEMALPLFAGGQLLGAIDVQSTEANAFSEQDVAALKVLADQVSMAINNTILFEQLQESLEGERRAYGEINQNAWQDLVRSKKNWGYLFKQNKTSPVKGSWHPEMENSYSRKETIKNQYGDNPSLSVPIKVSDHVIGVIRLSKSNEGIPWTEDEEDLIETLMDRLGQALESARLFQDSQRRAAQEILTTEISSNIRQSLDMDEVMLNAVKELGKAFNANDVIIRMKSKDSTE